MIDSLMIPSGGVTKMNNTKNGKVDSVIKLILFLVSPFIAFLYSLRNMNAKSSFVIFFLFCLCFGMVFTTPQDDYPLDGKYYRFIFEKMVFISTFDYALLLNEFAEFDEGSKDFYDTTISFVISRFTDNYHVLFFVYAAIFSFFMLKSFKFLTNERNFDNSFTSFVLATLFILSNSIFNINGVRFWTAAWIGVYCIFQLFRNNNRRYFLLALCTPIVHVSFYFFVAILIIAYFTKKYEKFWLILFVVSFFTSNFTSSILASISQFLPSFISNTIQTYITFKMEISLHKYVFGIIEWLFVNILVFIFYYNKKIIQQQPIAYNLYLFLVVFIVFVNFTLPIQSIGTRFIELSIPFIVYIWLLVFKDRKYTFVLYLFPIVNLYKYFILGTLYILVTEYDLFVMNPFFLIYTYLFA